MVDHADDREAVDKPLLGSGSGLPEDSIVLDRIGFVERAVWADRERRFRGEPIGRKGGLRWWDPGRQISRIMHAQDSLLAIHGFPS